jgi:hypothetical protein
MPFGLTFIGNLHGILLSWHKFTSWSYLKNKRNILFNVKHSMVFGKDEVTMFELTGLLGKQLN